MDLRKADTRRKIQLGGLVIKAELADEPSAVLFGLLLEAAATLAGPDAGVARRRWLRLGDAAFTADQEQRR